MNNLWLADLVFILHTLVTILAALWAALVSQPGLAAVIGFLWVLAFVLWMEFRAMLKDTSGLELVE